MGFFFFFRKDSNNYRIKQPCSLFLQSLPSIFMYFYIFRTFLSPFFGKKVGRSEKTAHLCSVLFN